MGGPCFEIHIALPEDMLLSMSVRDALSVLSRLGIESAFKYVRDASISWASVSDTTGLLHIADAEHSLRAIILAPRRETGTFCIAVSAEEMDARFGPYPWPGPTPGAIAAHRAALRSLRNLKHEYDVRAAYLVQEDWPTPLPGRDMAGICVARHVADEAGWCGRDANQDYRLLPW